MAMMILILVILALITVPSKQQLSPTAQWPKYAFENANTGRCPHPLSVLSAPYELWSFTTKDFYRGSVLASPAVSANGDIIFGAQDRVVYCLASDGEIKWGFGASSYLSVSPTLTKDGSVLIGSNDNQLYSLDAETGLLRWNFTAGDQVNSAPVVTDTGDIVICSWDKKVYCLSSNGLLRWSYLTSASIFTSAALSPDGSSIIVGNKDGIIYNLSPDGILRWNVTLPGKPFSPAIDDDGSIAVTAGKKLYYLSPSGSLLWSYTGKGDVASGPAIARDGSVIAGFNDYAGTSWNDHRIVSYSRSGVLQWSYSTGASTNNIIRGPSSSATITGDDYILYGAHDDHVHCLDAQGRPVWNMSLTHTPYASPILTADGLVLVANIGGVISLLGNAPSAAPTPAPTSNPSLHPTLFPSAAPFQPPPPAALITVNDGQILAASCVSSLALAVAIVLLRGGFSLAFLAPVWRLLSLKASARSSSAGKSQEAKEAKPRLIQFGPLEIIIPVTLTLAAAASNILQVSHFLIAGSSHPNQQIFAWIMVGGRVCVAVQAVVLLTLSFSRESYTQYIAAIYLHSPLVWILISLATMCDVSHVRFLPWRHSAFADRSRGFPTPALFKWSLLSSSLNSLLQLSLSVARGLASTASLASFLLSLASFLFTLATAALRLQAERIHDREVQGDVGIGVGVGVETAAVGGPEGVRGVQGDRLPGGELELRGLPAAPMAEQDAGGGRQSIDGSAADTVKVSSTLNPLVLCSHPPPHDPIPEARAV